MLFEILKMLLPFVGGGLAGAVLNEWLRRRSGKLQSIPLIERANRLVDPELEGFALARIVGGPDGRHLEEIKHLREYQMTLRNTSTIHLQDAEIHFEFPTEDVEAWASRPTLSKTALVALEASINDPWKKGFRWRIPYFPATDSVEFSFRAVDPPSDDYEVALYKTDRVIIQRSTGEPIVKGRAGHLMIFGTAAAAAACIFAVMGLFSPRTTGTRSSTLKEAGCTLAVSSTFIPINPQPAKWPWSDFGPWEIYNSALNIGLQKCVVQSEQLTAEQSATLEPGTTASRTFYAAFTPKPVRYELALGVDSPARKIQVEFYNDQK